MWLFPLALLLGIVPAAAQLPPLPQTVPVHNPAGEVIGTATADGNRVYIRDKKNEHIYTFVVEADGTKRVFDPNGKLLDWSVQAPK
jgi:hypothetical protein